MKNTQKGNISIVAGLVGVIVLVGAVLIVGLLSAEPDIQRGQPKTVNLLKKEKGSTSAAKSTYVVKKEDIDLLTKAYSRDSSKNDRISSEKKLLDMGPKVVPVLREGIKHPDKSIKIGSIRLLGELKAKKAVPDLLQYLRETKNNSAIFVVSYALGQIQDKRATTDLIDMALSSINDVDKRGAAIVSLGLLGDVTAIPALKKILSDNNERLQVFAAGSLGLLGSDMGLDITLKATQSKDSSIRKHAIQALGFIGNNKALVVLDDLEKQGLPIVNQRAVNLAKFQVELHSLSKDSKITIIKSKLLSEQNNPTLILWGLSELERMGGERAKNALNDIAQTHNLPSIRSQAFRLHSILNITEKLQTEVGE